MADKKNKRPKHTQLVVPGGNKRKGRYKQVGKDRLGRTTPPAAVAGSGTPPAPPPADPTPPGAGPPSAQQVADGGFALMPSADPPPPPPAGDEKSTPPKAGGKTEAGKKPGKLIRWPKRTKKDGERAKPEGEEKTEAGAIPQKPKPVKKKKKLSPVKRKRRRRRIQALVVLALAVVLLLGYTSGFYLTAATLAGDAWESLRLSASPNAGFPKSFAMVGFIKAEPLGTGGFVALGEREAAIVLEKGPERRIQHTYMLPGVSAGNTRAVVYSRSGREFTVEGRSKTLTHGTTDKDIQFAEMSPGGWLLIATASRHMSEVMVYGPTYDTTDPIFEWRQADEDPIMADFHKDNKGLLVGTVSAAGGALGSTIHVLRTDRTEPLATIRANGAQLLQLHYLDNHNILALYDSFTVLYNQKGEELARYNYGQRRLLNADVTGGNTALLFGAASQEALHVVLLDGRLEPLFDAGAEVVSGTGARVLANSRGAFLLHGQQVVAYGVEGAVAAVMTAEEKTLGLVHGGQPLLLANGVVSPLEGLLGGLAAAGSAPSAVGPSAGQSATGSLPDSTAPGGSSTLGDNTSAPTSTPGGDADEGEN